MTDLQKISKYEILEKIGQGGMGSLYKARDPLIGRLVAIKIISAHLDADPGARARFLREAQSAGQLTHPNIVTVYDMGAEGDRLYLVMEHLDGRDLRTRLTAGEPIALDRKLDIIIAICDALAHAHAKQITHRDIKPANVFITTTGQVKIHDFGLA